MSKEIKKIVRQAERRGWAFENGRVHDKLVHPTGRKVSVSKSPSDRMAPRNVQRDIDRIEKEASDAER